MTGVHFFLFFVPSLGFLLTQFDFPLQLSSVSSTLYRTDFRSPKTTAVAQKVGLERILLESDHEDAASVPESIHSCITFMADCFQTDHETIIQQTTQNAYDFYGIPQASLQE